MKFGANAHRNPDHRIEDHVDHQREPSADAVGPQPEQQRPHRAHRQGGRGDERDLGLAAVESLCDVGIDEHDDEVVEGVHRPAQKRRNERVALIAGQPLSSHVSIVQYRPQYRESVRMHASKFRCMRIIDADGHVAENPSLAIEAIKRWPEHVKLSTDERPRLMIEGRNYPEDQGPGAGCPPEHGISKAPDINCAAAAGGAR